jgi:hypothetical protein
MPQTFAHHQKEASLVAPFSIYKKSQDINPHKGGVFGKNHHFISMILSSKWVTLLEVMVTV